MSILEVCKAWLGKPGAAWSDLVAEPAKDKEVDSRHVGLSIPELDH